MKGIRHLSIEIGPHCDRARDHIMCPAHYRQVDRALMSTERIAETIRAALELGFEGYVGFHFYNEPTLYGSRMTEVMDAVPEARYMLWSNGFETKLHPRFDWVEVTNYATATFDDRLDNYQGEGWGQACWRPLIECAIDYSGRIALCCQDWNLTALDLSVVQSEPIDAFKAWSRIAHEVTQGKTPHVCSTCKGGRNQAQYEYALREVGM